MLGTVHDSTGLKQVKTIVTGLTGPSASMQDPDKTKSLKTNINKLSTKSLGELNCSNACSEWSYTSSTVVLSKVASAGIRYCGIADVSNNKTLDTPRLFHSGLLPLGVSEARAHTALSLSESLPAAAAESSASIPLLTRHPWYSSRTPHLPDT